MKKLCVSFVALLCLLSSAFSKPTFPFVYVEKFFSYNNGKADDVKKLRIVVFVRIHLPVQRINIKTDLF